MMEEASSHSAPFLMQPRPTRESITHSGLSPSYANQQLENTSQTGPQDNLMKEISQLRCPLFQV